MERTIPGVVLPGKPEHRFWDVVVGSETVSSIQEHRCGVDQSCDHAVLLPAMCHPHIHLDKAFLFSHDKYSEFFPRDGSFAEALKNTAAAKSRFTDDDLYTRGSWVIEESLEAGVTAMRAFVEVDATVGFRCVNAATRLKREYRSRCVIQICAFAQDPIFSQADGERNRSLLENVLERKEVEVLGTTPYVEADLESSKRNIRWAIGTALRMDKHLDFHLDYNLDDRLRPMIWTVVDELSAARWTWAGGKTVAIGHGTRMTLFSDTEMKELAGKIEENHLNISFIGLPTSDLYMMGRPASNDPSPNQRLRGTLQIPALIRKYGLRGTIGINNVGNPFTPYGSLDPLRLASIGVGLYHAGTADDAALLYECVSTRARAAIGLSQEHISATVEVGDDIDFVCIKRNLNNGLPSAPARSQERFADIVWDPPSNERRTVIFVPSIGTD